MTISQTRPTTVLVIEDEPSHRELVRDRLSAGGEDFEATFAGTCGEAVALLADESFDCIVLDHNLPDGTGEVFLRDAHPRIMTTPVVAFSTSIDPDVILAELKGGCVDFVPKREAFKGDTLRRAIDKAIDRYRTRAAVERSGSSAELIERAEDILCAGGPGPAGGVEGLDAKLQLIYETAVRTTNDGVLLLDRRSKVVYANPGLKRLVGTPEGENLPGHPLTTIDDLFTRESADGMRTHADTRQSYEAMIRGHDGTPVPVQVGESPIGTHGTLLAVTDLRQIKDQQRQLEVQNRRLTALNEMANRFVDNVSHEFRTPLTVIKGYAELLAQGIIGPVSDEQQQHLRTIIDRTRDLTQMVDDLLDSSKLRARRLRVDRRNHSVESIIESVRVAIEHKAGANQIELDLDIPADLPPVYADAEKAGRVIVNLTVNAIKFSDENSVVTIRAREISGGRVQIAVIDRGPGISEENRRLIFERFKQVGDPQRSSTKGFGLGLSIASELVAMNLGTMRVDSTPGEGSTFCFDLLGDNPSLAARALLCQPVDPDDPPQSIAIIRVSTPRNDAIPEKLRGFLASNLYPMDLILSSRVDSSLTIFGLTSNPGAWAARLARVCDRWRKDLDSPDIPELLVTMSRSWAYRPELFDEACKHLGRLIERPEEERT